MEHREPPVDWGLAARLAARWAPPGAVADRAELVDLVATLRESAREAAAHAARITRLSPADGSEPVQASRVLVVDRAGWARANTRTLAQMTADATERTGTSDAPHRAWPAAVARPAAAVTRRGGAVQVGGVLALLSGKVLGQFDPFGTGAPGHLLLVAPNVLAVQRALQVDLADFALWVALHEQTHALQFAAAPWLADHLRGRAGDLLGDLGASGAPTPGAVQVATAVARTVTDPTSEGLLDLLTPEQRTAVDEVGAVMSLLEGHADVAMDAVGPAVVPSVRQIRARFEQRRDASAGSRGTAGVLRRLLAMDSKLAQYRDGARFVRRVRRRVGIDGLNAVWTGPDVLPTPAEIADPAGWVRRVHG